MICGFVAIGTDVLYGLFDPVEQAAGNVVIVVTPSYVNHGEKSNRRLVSQHVR